MLRVGVDHSQSSSTPLRHLRAPSPSQYTDREANVLGGANIYKGLAQVLSPCPPSLARYPTTVHYNQLQIAPSTACDIQRILHCRQTRRQEQSYQTATCPVGSLATTHKSETRSDAIIVNTQIPSILVTHVRALRALASPLVTAGTASSRRSPFIAHTDLPAAYPICTYSPNTLALN